MSESKTQPPLEYLKVSVSGCCLGFFSYDYMKDPHFQEGFLIGELVETRVPKITDHENPLLVITRSVRISSFVPCPYLGYFYDGNGKVDFEKVTSLLLDLGSKIVGYFKYKPYSTKLLPTLRETLIYKELADSSMITLPKDYFVYCLATSEESENKVTHTHDQFFYKYHNNQFEPMKLEIIAMPKVNINVMTTEPVSGLMAQVLEEVKIKMEKNKKLSYIDTVLSVLAQHLESIINTIVDAEIELIKLEQEIKLMRNLEVEGE